MHKKLILSLGLLVSIPITLRGDLGLPDVQAICKVELKDGRTIEGVILVAKGGYQRYLDTNGFLLIVDKIQKAVLFNTDFYAIRPYEGVVERSPHNRSGWGPWFKNPKVYYLRDVTSKYYGDFKQTEIKEQVDTANSLLVLKRDIIHHVEYELLPYIPIFPKVPEELFLRGKVKSIKPLHVDVRDIQRFELVWEPSQKWIAQISAVKDKWIKTHDTFEVVFPVWFHQVIKEKERYKKLFKPWEF